MIRVRDEKDYNHKFYILYLPKISHAYAFCTASISSLHQTPIT